MIGYGIVGIFGLLLAVILIRTAAFRPKSQPEVSGDPREFDREGAIHALAELIKCKTISYSDPSLEDNEEFEKLIALLPKLYPQVFGACEFQRLPDRALLLRWPGKSSSAPAVLMAHYDVVPVEEANWQKPPFAAIIEDGVLWGRGADQSDGAIASHLKPRRTRIQLFCTGKCGRRQKRRPAVGHALLCI